MRVTVLYGGQIASAVGAAREEVELPDGASLADLLDLLDRRHGGRLSQGMRSLPRVLVLVNGLSVDPSRAPDVRLQDGAFVSILPPVSGGF